jgi:hypothetical protein
MAKDEWYGPKTNVSMGNNNLDDEIRRLQGDLGGIKIMGAPKIIGGEESEFPIKSNNLERDAVNFSQASFQEIQSVHHRVPVIMYLALFAGLFLALGFTGNKPYFSEKYLDKDIPCEIQHKYKKNRFGIVNTSLTLVYTGEKTIELPGVSKRNWNKWDKEKKFTAIEHYLH